MKRWLGIIAIIVLIFTACGGDNDEGTNNESNADFSVLYGEWRYYWSNFNTMIIYIISEDEIELYWETQNGIGSGLQRKYEIKKVKKDTNNQFGSNKNEYPEGFRIESVIAYSNSEYYVVGAAETLRFYLNENKDKMEKDSDSYIKTPVE